MGKVRLGLIIALHRNIAQMWPIAADVARSVVCVSMSWGHADMDNMRRNG